MIKAVFFDLDGTLLPLNEEIFTKGYFKLLCNYALPYGYEPNKLVESIWTCTKAMYKNNGEQTNQIVFWDNFAKIYGEEKKQDEKVFDRFYDTDFVNTKTFCGPNPLARQIIDYLRKQNIKIVLATNPIFPKNAITTRLKFIDLNEEDFDIITSYEHFHYTKSSPKYYQEILNILDLKPEDVIMFGNNEIEDGEIAKEAGIKAYMVGEYIISASDTTTIFKHHKFNDVINIIESHLK